MTRSSSSPLSSSPAGPARTVRQAARGQEDLADARHRGQRARAQVVRRRSGRSRQPSTSAPSTRAYFSSTRTARAASGVVGGQEDQAGRVRADRRQLEVDHGAVELVRHLDHDAGAVAGVRLGTPGTTVVETAQRGQARADHVVGAAAGDIHHEGDTAGVVLVARVVEALGRGAVMRPPDVVRCKDGTTSAQKLCRRV